MAASEGRSTLDRKVSFIGGDRVLCVSSLSREAIKQVRFSQHRSIRDSSEAYLEFLLKVHLPRVH